jgi:hypothetical protein
MLERFAREKYSSLLRKIVTYGRKTFYNIGPCLSYKQRANSDCDFAGAWCFTPYNFVMICNLA